MQKSFYVTSSTKEEIYAKIWKNEEIQHYRGIVQLVHGMEEHIGRYEDFAEILSKQGYIVVGHDHLGHGNTAKKEEDFGYFAKKDGWNHLAEDVHILQNKIAKEYSKLPYFIFGHSMGSLVVRTYLTKYQDDLAGVILSGTSGQKAGLLTGQILTKLIMLVKGERYRSSLLEYLVTGSFNKKFKPNRTKADWTTRDEQQVDKYQKDPKCGINFTTNGYLNLLKGTYYLSKQKNINKTNPIPILLISGDKDPVGGMGKGVIRVLNMLEKAGLKQVDIRLFKDARHELLNEVNRDEVYYVIFNWLNKILEDLK
ncbi:MAG: alpha/beta hydrolase [Clostridia bacterium]|nr:alpha/beta hydrolase [Clostridia bacterium]